jgi:hypothetical protein
LIAFARELGAPAWLLTAGGVMGAMFLLGEPFQKNLKAWRQSLGLKPEPPSKGSPAPRDAPLVCVKHLLSFLLISFS